MKAIYMDVTGKNGGVLRHVCNIPVAAHVALDKYVNGHSKHRNVSFTKSFRVNTHEPDQ
jgi:hypothetical protein